MSDRELLELAAKAAGIRINHWIYDDLDYSAAVLETGEVWHPLANGGDALGLAVKLEISINPFAGKTVVTYTVDNTRRGPYEKWDCNDNNPYAATRRAIVRAAAEIGRNMK